MTTALGVALVVLGFVFVVGVVLVGLAFWVALKVLGAALRMAWSALAWLLNVFSSWIKPAAIVSITMIGGQAGLADGTGADVQAQEARNPPALQAQVDSWEGAAQKAQNLTTAINDLVVIVEVSVSPVLGLFVVGILERANGSGPFPFWAQDWFLLTMGLILALSACKRLLPTVPFLGEAGGFCLEILAHAIAYPALLSRLMLCLGGGSLGADSRPLLANAVLSTLDAHELELALVLLLSAPVYLASASLSLSLRSLGLTTGIPAAVARTGRLGLLFILVGCRLINQTLGLAVLVLYAVAALALFRWAIRRIHFIILRILDLLEHGGRPPTEAWAFTAARLQGLPRYSLVRLTNDDGVLVLDRLPITWFPFPRRSERLVLGPASAFALRVSWASITLDRVSTPPDALLVLRHPKRIDAGSLQRRLGVPTLHRSQLLDACQNFRGSLKLRLSHQEDGHAG